MKQNLQSLLILVLAILLFAGVVGYRYVSLGCQPGTVCVQIATPQP